MIVAVSDMHLGYSHSNESLFREFLKEIAENTEVDYFVLAGDLFEMWRRDPLKLLVSNLDILNLLKEMHKRTRGVHLLAGNHDYHMIELAQEVFSQFNFTVSMDLTLSYSNQNYYFVHGHQFEHPDNLDMYHTFADILCMSNDEMGSTLDSLWELYKILCPLFRRTRAQFEEDFKKMLISPEERLTQKDIEKITQEACKKLEDVGNRPDEYLIYGHTHNPLVDEKTHVANTGSWVYDPDLPSRQTNTYITIEEGEPPKLVKFH